MVLKYKKQAFKINLGKSLNQNFEPLLKFFKGGWQRILVVGESGEGKSAHTKDFTVTISKIRKVCIFSVKGED